MARGVMAYTLPLLISLSVAGAVSPDSVVLRGSKPRHAAPALRKSTLLAEAPARRHQPEGAPTKREEVQARIEARNSAPGH